MGPWEIRRAGATSLHQVADALNAHGITTPRGGRWYAKSVSNMLSGAVPLSSAPMWRERPLPQLSAFFIEPCLPRPAKEPPAGRGWIHEIKHDGFRIMARRADGRVRLLTRNGTNFANRFPQIVAAVTLLPVRSCLIDGEAVVCDESGLAVFELLRGYRHDAAAVLCAFDLLELDGGDLRRIPIEERRDALAKLLSCPHEGIAFNQHYTGEAL